MSNANNHAKIAEKVWTDASADVEHPQDGREAICQVHFLDESWPRVEVFNLLETDSEGRPTQQAKASALDVLLYFGFSRPIKVQGKNEWFCFDTKEIATGTFFSSSDSQVGAIYRAACEVLGLEVEG